MQSPRARPVAEANAPVRVLVVDDQSPIRRLLSKLLQPRGYVCTPAANAAEAQRLLEEEPFELMLCDVNMPPGRSGIELVREVLERHPDVAAIMVTAEDDTEVAETALNLGAYGYVIKPFKANELLINIFNALRRRRLEIEHRAHQEILEATVQDRTVELRRTLVHLQEAEHALREAHEETVHRLMRAAEFRDNETAQHIVRMSRFCELLARASGMNAEECELMRLASPMHDIGKIGTPDHILLKPGRLSAEAFQTMKQHAEIGYRILHGTGMPILRLGASIALTHHEKYDGSGYPRGLAGEAIPLEGRITAVADVFDALTSRRVYKPAYSVEESVALMREQRGRHLDPVLLDRFLDNLDEVGAIKREYPDD